MPIYVFRCDKCNKIWELLIKLADFDKKVECPDCKKEMKRLMCSVPFKFN